MEPMCSHLCDFCGKAARKKCGNCERVNYCSREHQLPVIFPDLFVLQYVTNSQAWPQHKDLCKFYKARQKAGRGSIIDKIVKMEEHKAIEYAKTLLDRLPCSAGSLLLFLSILGCQPMDKRFFKYAAEHSLVKILIGANKICEPLLPFIGLTNNKWNERTFHDALSVLVALEFVKIADDNDDVFNVNNSAHDLVIRAVDTKTKRDIAGYATLLVGTTMLPDRQSTSLSTVLNMTPQMDACRKYSHAIMPELKEDGKDWEFWSAAVLNLANAYRERGEFLAAKELFLLSIGSGKDSKHWQAKFDLALMEGVDMNEWPIAENRLSDAMKQGSPRPETMRTCLNRLREADLLLNDEESKAHLKCLARLIFNGMGQGQRPNIGGSGNDLLISVMLISL
jgi:hypothetical protein